MDMGKKYGALPFDPDDSMDVLAERGRQMLLTAATDAVLDGAVPDGEHLQYLLGGLMVGIVQITMAHIEGDDAGWAATRAGMIQIVPWAVDQARSISNLDPLVDT